MAYLLDANVFIEAKNMYYGFDFCPAYWDWILTAHDAGTVFSIESVRDELVGGGDDLATWAQQRSDGFFMKPTPALVPSLQSVSNWAYGAGYEPAAVNTFLQAADYYLVATALATGLAVVTREVFSPSTKRIKIPNACIELGVRCLNPFHMLRAEGARFVLP